MENNDLDLSALIPILDKALTSDRENVKKALQELLVIVALTEPKPKRKGPLTSALEKIKKLEDMVERLSKDVSNLERKLVSSANPWDNTKSWGSQDIYEWEKLRRYTEQEKSDHKWYKDAYKVYLNGKGE